jgi:hypothetical protein
MKRPTKPVVIEIPGLPDPLCEANKASANRFAKADAVRSDRKRGKYTTLETFHHRDIENLQALLRSLKRVPYRVTIGLPKGAKRRDTDNVQHWPKALRDGISDALCEGWDGNWDLLSTTQVRDREGIGFVRFEFLLSEEG